MNTGKLRRRGDVHVDIDTSPTRVSPDFALSPSMYSARVVPATGRKPRNPTEIRGNDIDNDTQRSPTSVDGGLALQA